MVKKSIILPKAPRLPKIIAIVGPTASGKSELAIKLALHLNLRTSQVLKYKYRGAEIVSADSRQIYRGMDIGTAKPLRDRTTGVLRLTTKYISQGIIHHLIDIKNPDEEYTVAQYKKDCLNIIKGILSRKKIPILAGGTGLYIKAVLNNLKIPEVQPNFLMRRKLENNLKEKGLAYLYGELIKLDPEAAYIVDKNNPRRVIRALEITLQTSRPFSSQRKTGEPLFNALKIGIILPKEKLKKKIEKRADEMTKDGLIKEVKQLIRRYPVNLPAFEAIGYREIIDYLKGKQTLKAAIELIKKNTWRYAKRQITWFKKDKEIKWVKNFGEALRLTNKFLKTNHQ